MFKKLNIGPVTVTMDLIVQLYQTYIDCKRNHTYVHRVKLYYFVRIEMQVGVGTLILLKQSTDLQQSKYTLGYGDNNLIDVLPADL